MKNVTIALDDEVYRQARIRAAALGTSLSAMVKEYLTGLAHGSPAPVGGVRDVQVPFKHAEPAPDGPPWLVDGKLVYTRDGKPRQPGALRGKLRDLPDQGDEWPPEMQAFFDSLQNDPWDDEFADPLPFDESQLPPR